MDYALALDYFSWNYLEDDVKYRLLCENRSPGQAIQLGSACDGIL